MSTGLLLTTVGAAGLVIVVAILPVSGDERVTLAEQVLAYTLVVLPMGALLYGLLVLAADLAVARLLFLGAVTGALGVAAAYLGSRPEDLEGGPAVLPLTLLFFADTFRMAAAACLGLALARRVTSPGIALLIAGVAAAADLISVFAGPTRVLLEEGAPVLDYLLLIFPTFGYPLGFALGVADIVFLTLFTAMAHHLKLHPLPTLALGCAATLLSLLTGLLLARPLPALPFIALSFVLANASPLYKSFFEKEHS